MPPSACPSAEESVSNLPCALLPTPHRGAGTRGTDGCRKDARWDSVTAAPARFHTDMERLPTQFTVAHVKSAAHICNGEVSSF